ncbi:hypothetical protein [Halotia branconii]|uniref:Uncharacterized protein n=1 Tax=Halotia branconii CENA392 TaxID=1539056 RepID=A0AAJ6PA36_9CYAN|nr:hypothetical protein [Halotia branconii]WGV26385.1 hypothetical protein QI031_02405 [Halotia branconii CENA392]
MSRNQVISCLGTIAALLLLHQPQTLAQYLFSSAEPTEIYQLSTPQKLVIPPLAPSEISPAAVTESVAQENLLAPPRFDTIITRELPALWQMRVPLEQVGFLNATYEIRAENGRSNAVSNDRRSESAVSVALEPLPIIEVSRDQNSNTALIQGGVRLKMDLSTAQSAGAYGGDLTVTINQH